VESRFLENGNLEVTVKYVIRGISGRKRIIAPNVPLKDTEPLVVHIARAFRWRKHIDEGLFANTVELARSLGLEPGMVARTTRLTMLAPNIIHRIIMGDIPSKLNLGTLRTAIPDLWKEQEKIFLDE